MRIVFLGPLRSSFANVDVDILKTKHDVVAIDTLLGGGAVGILRLMRVTLRAVVAILSRDCVYCWFADYHTLVPVLVARLLGKRAIVVAGGFDIGYEPQINFGAKIRPIRWFCVRMSFRFATKILAVSQYAQHQLTSLTEGKHASAKVVYNAVRTQIADESVLDIVREPMIVTVSQGDSDVEIRRKGIDLFVRIASKMPHVRFRLIGLAGRHPIVRDAMSTTPNLEVFAGFVSFEDIVLPSYTHASAYAQLSIEEAFGVAMVESMICGCIPVTTGRAALREVVGDAGLYAVADDEIVDALTQALSATREDRHAARTRGLEFSAARRSQEVLASVQSN